MAKAKLKKAKKIIKTKVIAKAKKVIVKAKKIAVNAKKIAVKVKKVAVKAKTLKNKAVAKKVVAKKANSKKTAIAKPVLRAKLNLKAKITSNAKPIVKNLNKSKISVWDKLVTPLDDRIFVLAEEPVQKTSGGIFIPDSATGIENNQGTVVVAGRGHLDKKGKIHTLDVKKGDRVLYPKYSGSKITIDGSELLVLRESEVLGVVE